MYQFPLYELNNLKQTKIHIHIPSNEAQKNILWSMCQLREAGKTILIVSWKKAYIF